MAMIGEAAEFRHPSHSMVPFGDQYSAPQPTLRRSARRSLALLVEEPDQCERDGYEPRIVGVGG
jgi:hypothetical protein